MDTQTVKPTILVVDDTPANLDVMTGILSAKYKIKVALNGEKALQIATTKKPVDMILLDIMMPGMDGYEVCKRLKADASTRDIPVVFVTAMDEVGDEVKGLEVGAVDYIAKPVSPPIVLARVHAHLALKQNMEELQKAYRIIESQKQRMVDELNVGQRIQMNMLPRKFPPFPDRLEFSIHAALVPAREVGGDFYDFFFVDENRLCFCVGDVSGKGVPAALFMAAAKTLIKSRAKDDSSPASLITHVNSELSENNSSCMFVTIFIGILDIRSGLFLYTNAGHNPPYVRKPNGELQALTKRHGPVVGPVGGMTYGEASGQLFPGDTIVLYTDGVPEARSAAGAFFSDQRFVDLLKTGAYTSPEGVVQTIQSAVSAFQGEAEQADDITIVALQYAGRSVAGEAKIFEIAIKNQLPELLPFKSRFKEWAATVLVPGAIVPKIGIVFDELLSNIIKYGYRDEKEHDIFVKVELYGDSIKTEIVDDGIPFNPLERETPDTALPLEKRQVGGLGIHLVRELMDKVAYQRRIDRNILTFEKYL